MLFRSGLNGLAYLGLIASVVGVFYYLRVIWSMYFEEPTREFPTNIWNFSYGAPFVLTVCAIGSLLFGVLPNLLWPLCKTGGESLTSVSASAPIVSSTQPLAVPVPGTIQAPLTTQ